MHSQSQHSVGKGLCGPPLSPARRPAPSRAHLVVFAVGVAAAAVGQDAALAVEDVARVALAALHAVVVAVALQADGRTAGLAHAHAALVVAVGGAGDGCNGDTSQNWHKEGKPAPAPRPALPGWRVCGSGGRASFPTFAHDHPLC